MFNFFMRLFTNIPVETWDTKKNSEQIVCVPTRLKFNYSNVVWYEA